ncbi:hypothetical protein DFP72DRAFT_1165446 [Ephemerocybe angulata]|uniref:Malate dehydrogenase n=1 Tax=Ephemerocybe angulata TaxID=980116 RepID=A0A8H6IA50_9AGAR|nr:hypothetical protein DFP72DRAFT_1165446 [Tulosesus angulatus]
MFFSKSIIATTLFAASALAAPLFSCSTAKALMTLPANETALAKQTGAPSFALLGVGVQNYTCGADAKYASAGAVAELFDISCLGGTKAFDTVQDTAYNIFKLIPDKLISAKNAGLISAPIGVFSSGKHFFTPTATGTAPVWDMRAVGVKSVQGKPDAYVLAAKVANLTAPNGAEDVPWLQLKNVEGDLATAIYRINTRGGQPPASCAVGSAPISVKYTSKYFLFGSTVV